MTYEGSSPSASTMNSVRPISAKQRQQIVPIERWIDEPEFLQKTFKFRRAIDRNDFVVELFEYEKQIKHLGKIEIVDDSVTVTLQTKTIELVTELDKEYAKFADVLYKDISCRVS